MSTCVISPQRNKGEPQLPAVGILAVNPSDSSSFPALSQQYHLKRHFLFHSNLYCNKAFFLAGPAIGAPMATICLEKIIALGATDIILYGWCGSLSPSLRMGDVFLPTSALSEEGTSAHYPPSATTFDDSLSVLLRQILTTQGYSPKQGPIWTTDAFYRETKEKVRQYSSRGIMAVDMEYSALRAVASFRQARLAAVMLVSDELYHQEWRPRFVDKSFRSASQQILAKLCALTTTNEVVPT
jgi:uridine phosphorylase